MTFQYPYAFFALLAIPVLILIYILRNKYKETTSPSTYLWEISQKFMKKRNPFHSIERLLALIVQCCTVAMLAVCLAHPVLTFKNGTDNIVFVLDSSASMNIKSADKTRFDVAKDQIMDTVKNAKNGTNFSLVTSGKEAKLVCQNIIDRDQFQMYVDSVSCTYSNTDLKDSIAQAQKLIAEGKASACYLATDKEIENYQNITLLDCSDDQINYAIGDLTYEEVTSEDVLNVYATITGYDKALQEKNEGKAEEQCEKMKVNVRITINDDSKGITQVDIIPGTPYSFKVGVPNRTQLGDISSINATVTNEDALAIDNTVSYYNNDTIVSTNLMLVSDKPLFFQSVFKALKDINVTTVSTSRYNADNAHNYDIYVYDCYMPETIPNDGAVWFFGAEDSNADCGFIYNSYREDSDGMVLDYANNTESVLYNELTKDLTQRELLVSRFARYNVSGAFTTILTYKNMPVIFAGKNNRQQREVVCAFDLHNSNLPIIADFIALMRNCINYSNPRLMSQFNYVIDSSALISVSDNVTKLTVKKPNGDEIPVMTNDTGYISYAFDQVGTYEISTVTDNNTDKTVRCFVSYPMEESDPFVKDENAYNIVINDNSEKGDSIFDNILPVVIAASVLFGLDWILYAHEQY